VQQGTLGASGDLAPLAHLALGMMGEGNMWNPKSCKYEDAGKVLKENGLMPLEFVFSSFLLHYCVAVGLSTF
jgi:histidine ammonia-lyase